MSIHLNLAEDILRGAEEISEFLFGDNARNFRRRVYHMVENGIIPTFRMGNTVCARKSTLMAWIESQERQFPLNVVEAHDPETATFGGV